MSTSLLYHTQCVVGFQHECFDFSEGKVIQHIKRQKIKCPCCRHESISAYPLRERMVQSLPYGNKPTFLKFTVHRIYCPRCGKEYVERFHFLSHPEARQTTALERTIVELRRDMSIHAISQYYHIPWSTVKNIEKRYLQTKFKTIPLKKVKVIGIDEIAIGRKKGKPVYWTIVRDLVSGAVLHVDKGKEGDSLKSFLFRLHCSKAKIELVAMDMGAAYTLWVKENLPGAAIVFDHFHVIKLMNDKLDMVRRRTMAQLDADELKLLKKKRFLLLHNQEDLNEEAAADLAVLKEHFKELGELHMMKEALRSIYRVVMTEDEAETALRDWCAKAMRIQSKPLQSMVKTIQSHWDGILGFWKYDGLTSAGMEGFNNKVRTMIRMAYGYRDEEYMVLKIYDLPNKRTNDGL